MKGARPVLVAYISGHGFGHYTRSLAILERLADTTEIHVRTSSQALGLALRARCFSSVTEVDVGPGVVQRGPLAVDIPATLDALSRHCQGFGRAAAEEAAYLSTVGARLVYADIPPLAFAAATLAGVPSVALGNFSWSFIYEGYAHHDRRYSELAARLAEAEAGATELLALDGGGGLEVYPRRRRIPPVARILHRSIAETRARLGLDEGDVRPVVLVSFGGFRSDLDSDGEVSLAQLSQRNPRFRFLYIVEHGGEWQDNFRLVCPDEDLPHQDLTAAASAVIGKPGYGTVAECLARPTAFVHVPRGEFREYPALVETLTRWLPSAALTVEDLRAGRWTEALELALASTPSGPVPMPTGAADAANFLKERL